MMKTGLVLEGGAMRGLYTAGVLDVFLDYDISFDGLIGVSAGTIHGCSYVSKQNGRSIRYYTRYSKDKNFMSWYSFFKTGDIVGRKMCYDDIPNRLDPFDNETFMQSNTDYYVTVTNCETGKAEYLLCKDLKKGIDHIRASCSMPLVSQMVELNGNLYLDGGIGDSIPVRQSMKMGYDKNVVVLTRPSGYRKKSELVALSKMKYKKYPHLIEAIKNRPNMYNNTIDDIEQLENEGKILVIRPSVDLHLSRLEKDPDRLREQYELGRKDAMNMIASVKEYLGIE